MHTNTDFTVIHNLWTENRMFMADKRTTTHKYYAYKNEAIPSKVYHNDKVYALDGMYVEDYTLTVDYVVMQ